MKPISLRSPNGTIYAYACGVCHHIAGTGGSFLVRVPPGTFAERALEEACACCRCRTCKRALKKAEGRFGNCAACEIAERAKEAERQEQYRAERSARPRLPETDQAHSLRDLLVSYDVDPDDADEVGLKILALVLPHVWPAPEGQG